ncbi:MAG: T9SS type A sorting domain-containing protein [Bacteroidia bacterium]|nr:T9SS type A sorting domain-containing protein [Bacteroidia bacterium]
MLSNKNEKDALLIFPNPAADFVNVQWKGENEECVVDLVDGQGKILMQQKINSIAGMNLYGLDISSLSKGTYMIIIRYYENGKMFKGRVCKM